jgi:hypothetical protein
MGSVGTGGLVGSVPLSRCRLPVGTLCGGVGVHFRATTGRGFGRSRSASGTYWQVA